MSKAHKQTDYILERLERQIAKLYKEASESLRDKVNRYFRQFEKEEKKLRAKLKAGEITDQDFINWRLQHITRTRDFLALRDEVAETITATAEKAAEVTAEVLPDIYAINYNEESDDVDAIPAIAAAVALAALTLPKLNKRKEREFNKRNFTAHVTSMIMIDHTPELHGKPSLVETLDFTAKRSRESMVSNARTLATYAENKGRQAVYDAMAKLGMKVSKQWFTQADNRVRHSHAKMHGVAVPEDKPFIVDGYELMFPGDGRSAQAHVYYNCRCYMRRERSKK